MEFASVELPSAIGTKGEKMDSLKRLAIVGAGQIAVEHLRVLEVLPEVEVVGITSRTRERAEKIAKEFQIPCVVDDLDTLMETAAPDGLLVLVSADQIYPVALKALDCGVPIFLEKPPGMVPEETKHLSELARTNGVPTLVGFNRRCYSIFRNGCEIIEQH